MGLQEIHDPLYAITQLQQGNYSEHKPAILDAAQRELQRLNDAIVQHDISGIRKFFRRVNRLFFASTPTQTRYRIDANDMEILKAQREILLEKIEWLQAHMS